MTIHTIKALPWIGLDYETTGLPNTDLPPDSPEQPRVLSVGVAMATQRTSIHSRLAFYLDPGPDVSRDPKAVTVHGITEETTRLRALDSASAGLALGFLLELRWHGLFLLYRADFEQQMTAIEMARRPVVGGECYGTGLRLLDDVWTPLPMVLDLKQVMRRVFDAQGLQYTTDMTRRKGGGLLYDARCQGPSLNAALEHFGLSRRDKCHHGAEEDAELNVVLAKRCLQEYPQHFDAEIAETAANFKRWGGPSMQKQAHRIYREGERWD